MKNKELTIIIPCFNAEKFLNKCIDSILNQKYNNFDLILINADLNILGITNPVCS